MTHSDGSRPLQRVFAFGVGGPNGSRCGGDGGDRVRSEKPVVGVEGRSVGMRAWGKKKVEDWCHEGIQSGGEQEHRGAGTSPLFFGRTLYLSPLFFLSFGPPDPQPESAWIYPSLLGWLAG